MKVSIVRIVTDAAGNSRFMDDLEELALAEFAPPAPAIGVSEPRPATAMRFIGAPAGRDLPPHPAPRRQWIVILHGTVDVGTTDGAVRRFVPGTVVRLEDTSGPGHSTRVLAGEDWLAMVVVD
jgi:hypothetical protein